MPRQRLIVPVLGLGQIVAFASSYYLLGVMAEPAARAVGGPPGVLFTALSGAFLISAALGPLVGRLIDARGGRTVLIACHGLFALALVGLGAAQTIWQAAAAVLALGLGMAGGLYGTAFAILVAWRGDAARRSITAVSLMGAFGGAVGWPTSLMLIETIGWRGACATWAAAHVLLCAPLCRLALPAGVRRAATPDGTAPMVWDRRMIQLAGLFAGAWFVQTAMAAHLPRLLGRLGLDPRQAAGAAALMAAAAIAVRLTDLLFGRHAHPVLSTRVATLLPPFGVATALIGGKLAAGAIALGQGAGNGLLNVASGVLPLHLFGRERYAARQALILTPARFVQAAAPALYGVVLDRSVLLGLAATTLVGLAMCALTFGLHARSAVSPVPSSS